MHHNLKRYVRSLLRTEHLQFENES